VAKRWAQRPDGSTWGDWGEDDELGRINLLTPQKVLEGAREVQLAHYWYRAKVADRALAASLRAAKAELDPAAILNPGVLLDP